MEIVHRTVWSLCSVQCGCGCEFVDRLLEMECGDGTV